MPVLRCGGLLTKDCWMSHKRKISVIGLGYVGLPAAAAFAKRVEGWGYAASECLDFGVPVIVSTTPALIEATRGLMPAIDADDQAGWYAAIRRIAEDMAWRSS